MPDAPISRFALTALLTLLLLPLAPAFAQDDTAQVDAEEKDPWTFTWKEGFKLDSPDGDFKLKFGGRIQLDFTAAETQEQIEDRFGEVLDGVEFRRGRLFVSGTLYDNVEFKAQFEFAGGEVEPKDVYVGLKKTPIGGVRVGHQKEPFSIETLTSSKYITFLERSLPILFAPERNTGILFHGSSERLTWGAGAFRETDDLGVSRSDSELNLTGRLAGRPVWRDGGRRLVHLGLSLSHKDFGDRVFRFRQRPEVHLAPRFADTEEFVLDTVELVDFEVAAVQGPFWTMSELISADVEAPGLGDLSFSGASVQAGWFLTGEHRRYKTSSGAFDRLRPNRNSRTGLKGGGAWEVAARWSTLDLEDGPIEGGRIDGVSLAVNWYLNPVTRVMINLVRSNVLGEGDQTFALLRLQVDF